MANVRSLRVFVLSTLATLPARGQQAPPPTEALDHAVWTTREGAPSALRALAQAADGVLWLGTNGGLFRFDGVRFEPFEPPPPQQLPSLSISALRALPDTTLWIGYFVGGLTVLRRQGLVTYSQRDGLPEGAITAIARDSTGDMWAATSSGLGRLHGTRWQRIGPESGFPGRMTSDLLVDRRGTLWASTPTGVFILPRGARQFSWGAPSLDPTAEGAGVPFETLDGSVWGASFRLGIRRLSDPSGHPISVHPGPPLLVGAWAATVDRHSYAWVLQTSGVVSRVPLARTGADETVRGQSARQVQRVPVTRDPVTPVLEDREGNLWVGTNDGIERFRETKLTPVTLPQPSIGLSVLPAGGGAVWIGRIFERLLAIQDGVVMDGGTPSRVTSAYRDRDGGAWFAGPNGMWYAPPEASPSNARFSRVALPEEAGAGDVQAIARAADGDLWISIRGKRMRGIFRRHGVRWSLVPLPPGFSEQIAWTVVADTSGGVWLGYVGNRLVYSRADSTHVYNDSAGLHLGAVTALLARGTRIWVGGEMGLAQLADGRFRYLHARGSLRGITGIIETPNGDVWLNGADGITRIGAAEVQHALSDSTYQAQIERFDHHDGLRGQAAQVRPFPTAIEGADGRLWFTTESGVVWINPAKITRNTVSPPVQIRSVSAAGTRYAVGNRIALPLGTTQLQIAYTALSFAMPDRVQFRYRLSGVDTGWVEAGTRREAYYTNLKPGKYRFRVIAGNEDGVWNESGAGVAVEIPPTFTQTRAFAGLIAASIVCALWLLALWRQRQLAATLQAQFDGQLAERTRVARELHDTLLGDMAGMAMQLEVGVHRAETGDTSRADLVDLLSSLRTQVQRSLIEARRSVTGIRTQPVGHLPSIHERLAATAQRIFADTGVALHVEHTGPPRSCAPAVGSEVTAIAAEAMMNARKHSQCRSLTVGCVYEPGALRVRLQDDGRGFDVSNDVAAGHWGLIGMRERAVSIGATLTVRSAPAWGTEVLLVVPEPKGRRRWWARQRRLLSAEDERALLPK